ncbi:MAG: DUF6172 family protein [Verrucomicrobia bacterium]|nr:DUF6172 family protein [Verrucomicrobiota bacterium]
MKKTFPLHVPGKEAPRVLDAIKLEITKYVKRERRKTLPPEFDVWDFACKVGSDSGTATSIPLPEVPKAVESVALAGVDEVYVEIMASAGNRVKRPSSAPHHRREP